MHEELPESIVNVLDDITANKIAAGEVVERPASVVKELVENALDAGADEIKIELADGGKKLIRVSDNGQGMSRRDAVLCLQRHATSKISSADDLFSIMTLGFRGEALPSICSVSRMEIVTRRENDECGTTVVCAGGDVLEVSDAGGPHGTSVSVSDLFCNLPARQKFLKTAQTELGHSLELLNHFVISHPEVNFTLSHNGRAILKSPGSGKLEDAILTVFGRDAAEAVMPVIGISGSYRVHGFVSRVHYSKQNRSGQLFYVNRRYVRNRNLIHALDDAYRGILTQGRFPLFVGFVEVDPELVDVNVHPTKIEVKFTKEWEVHNLVATSIREALASSAVAPTGEDILPMAASPIDRPDFARSSESFRRDVAIRSFTHSMADLEAFREALATRLGSSAAPNSEMPGAVGRDEGSASGETDVRTDLLAGAVVLAQARNMYIVAQSPAGVLIIDQHVAHERILHDQLSGTTGEVQVQRLVMPITLDLGKREALVMETKLPDLRAMGFDIEPFGREAFVVRSVPVIIAKRNCEQILRDTIEELTELTLAKRLIVQRDAIITTTSCKMAVKAGERLSMEEMARLVAELRQTSNPYLCPHGRPIVVCFSNRDLDKMFGR
jgi:DNA mismatch repair protein MutL